MKNYVGTKFIQAEEQMKDGKEGYKVVYADGYESWSPKDVFEEAYKDCLGMTFGVALELLKKGFKVARQGWNGKGMFLVLTEGSEVPTENMRNDVTREYYEKVNEDTVKICGHIDMKAADGSMVIGWLASQTDMLAEDWVIVEHGIENV